MSALGYRIPNYLYYNSTEEPSVPNNIDNYLSIYGEEEDLQALVDAAKIPAPPPGDKNGTEWNAHPQVFSFHGLVPLPEEYSRNPYGDGSPKSGYELEVETWGIKWGAYAPYAYDGIPDPERDRELVTYHFCTAWDAPYQKFIPKVFARFPTLTYFLSWGGEGPTRGRGLWTNTGPDSDLIITHPEPYREEDYPDNYEDGMSEEEERACGKRNRERERIRMSTHHVWIGHLLSRKLGREFTVDADPAVMADFLQEHDLHTLAERVRQGSQLTDEEPLIEVRL